MPKHSNRFLLSNEHEHTKMDVKVEQSVRNALKTINTPRGADVGLRSKKFAPSSDVG